MLAFTGKKAMLQNQDIHLGKYTYYNITLSHITTLLSSLLYQDVT